MGFPRTVKLVKRSEFLEVQRQGIRFGGKHLVIYIHAAGDPERAARFGITVSKRVSVRAVRRNRVRRLIREAFRMLRPTIRPGHWVVAIARRSSLEATGADINAELRRLLARAGLGQEAS